MPYSDAITLTTTNLSTARDFHVFRANSIYGPNYTTGNGETPHQAMGYNQANANYEHYVVLGAKATFKFTTTDVHPVRVGVITQSDLTSTCATMNICQENNLGKTAIVTADKPVTLTARYSPKNMFGVRNTDMVANLRSAFEADPVETAGFAVLVANQDATLGAHKIYIDVKIEYFVKCSEVNRQGGD